jgi:hypothetical protein
MEVKLREFLISATINTILGKAQLLNVEAVPQHIYGGAGGDLGTSW